MITVMGATGNTGRLIVQSLLEQGLAVRAIARNPERLALLAREGAQIRSGDVGDEAFLTEAFSGSKAVYTLLPTDRSSPDYRAEQDRQGRAIAGALRSSGVGHAVALSSVGAERADAPGILAGLAAQELRLRELEETAVLLLRPVSFYENFLDSLPLIAGEGIVADGLAADVPQPMVAARDIAAVATRALASRDWRGVKVREVVGPRELTAREATRILGSRIGRPDLAYVQLGSEELVGALVGAGLSESFARMYQEMTAAMNRRELHPRGDGSAEQTAGTPFEDFADGFALLFASQLAGPGAPVSP